MVLVKRKNNIYLKNLSYKLYLKLISMLYTNYSSANLATTAALKSSVPTLISATSSRQMAHLMTDFVLDTAVLTMQSVQ